MNRAVLMVIGILVILVSLCYAEGDLIVDGKLGVGTASPRGLLELSSNADGTQRPNLVLSNEFAGLGHSAYDYYYLYHGNEGCQGDGLFIGYNTAFVDPCVSNDKLVTILKNGNLGIGTPSPSIKLFVNGDAGGTSPWFNESDRRLKKDIEKIDHGLAKVLKLRGVYFSWNDSEAHGEGRQMGMIAQEVKEIAPEVVRKKGDHYSMATANLVPVLIEAIKEQQYMIEEQKAKITQLQIQQAMISALADKVNALETQMKLQSTVALAESPGRKN